MDCRTLGESRSRVVVVRPDPAHRTLWPALLDRSGHAAGDSEATRLRPQVTLIVQDEAARVLDTHCGNFYALDAIGTRMLFATLERGAEAMVCTLARDFAVPETQVREDWTTLVRELANAGLTETVRCQSRASRWSPSRF